MKMKAFAVFGNLFFLLSTRLLATEYYMTPSGAGAQDGSNWENALAKSALGTTLNTTMGAGDSLFLGSGNYGSSSLSLTSSGTAGAWKSVIGVDTGSGVPHFSGSGNWYRSNPDSGQWQIVNVAGNYWHVENLELSGVQYAVKNSTSARPSHYQFKDLYIHDVRHGVYLSYLDDSRFDNVLVTAYTKQGFRLDRGCDNVVFENCVADLTGDDASWWDYSEPFPFGFVLYNNGANSNISFVDCVAANNRRNNQGISYWNGDGFVVENTTTGVSFENCLAINNEDGGFDLKPVATLVDCVSVLNYRGFRFWGNSSAENCVAVAPYRRSNGNPTGGYGGAGAWTKNGTATLSHFTFYADAGTAAHEEGSGNLTLTDSILAFTGAGGGFTSGSITLGAGTVTYRPGSGVDPDFVNASIAWDGTGTDLNSQTYGDTKGYYFDAGVPMVEWVLPEADAYVHNDNPTTNYGSVEQMLVKHVNSSEYTRNSYVRFPISGISENMSSATLKLKVKAIGGEGSGSRWVEVRMLNDDSWGESSVTWNNRPTVGSTIATIDAGTVDETYEIDVTAYVQSEYANDGVVSFALVQPTNTNKLVSFYSRESTGNEPTLEVEYVDDPVEPVLVFDAGNFSDYSSQSTSGGMTLEASDTAIHLSGNTWRKYAYAYTVTANTVIEVTVDASDVGELFCIGLDSDNNYATGATNIKIAGSQTHASFVPVGTAYTAGSGPVTYLIPVGTVFTGSMTYLTFIGDDDANENCDVTFSDIRIYENE
ncbi:DNRLRE domain-containing protein [Kiritimatiellaeota bacterium B1221]|nr:DNRLRE domain-containing protein [Kiritimatiellaeota bacterium B1221]